MSWIQDVGYAIKDTPRRIAVSFKWKARARNSIQKILETLVGLVVAVGIMMWLDRPIVAVIAGFCAQWVFFEWICEPAKLSGYYWERGPRRGDKGDNGGYFWLE